jgi:hypothetical protein
MNSEFDFYVVCHLCDYTEDVSTYRRDSWAINDCCKQDVCQKCVEVEADAAVSA